MAAKTKRSKKQTSPDPPVRKGWIDRKAGIKMIAAVSILLAIFEGWQISSFKSPLESILWGLIFGASIWAIAGFFYVLNRWIRRG